jgi:tetratricopeptide (TPR) repeat protein
VKLILCSLICIGTALAADDDPIATARRLATGGNRPAALRLLENRLAEHPADSDARLLRGIILSWDGRYVEARREIETVIEKHRDYSDALCALIRVEVWSGHAGQAAVLAREALRRNPRDPALLMEQAKVLRTLGRNHEAVDSLRQLRAIDPRNQEALRQERDLGAAIRSWMATFDQSVEWFSDGRDPWREQQFQLERQTGMGALIARFSQANRFSLSGRQVEIDAYPHLRAGTYAYLNLGYSPDRRLYPGYRFGTDLYQTLGHGWEASAGFGCSISPATSTSTPRR